MRKLLLIIMGFILIILLSQSIRALIHKSEAETIDTGLTVNNSAPSFTTGPVESTASTGTSPTDEGNDVTFTATANDENGEDYYLTICKTDAVTGGSSGSAPTCDGGAWCVSTATNSDSEASCSHTTLDGDVESNVWYAFVCDDNTTSEACTTTGDQGTGDGGSPFFVNHDPSFTVIEDDGGTGADSGADPGGTITFTATASDTDTDTSSDTVKLVVCADTSGATSTGCSGTEICVSTAAASNPSCTEPIPAVRLDASINYYAYIFDSHDFNSNSNYFSGTYQINNVSPTVSAVTINGGSDIDLTESTTTNVVVTGTVVDNNSCQDLVTVEASIYRSAVTYSGCDTDAEDDDNDCYAQVTCSVSGGSCTGSTDASVDYTCSIPVQFHADPTITSTPYVANNWLSTMKAVDSALSDNDEVETGVEMNSLNAIDLSTATINYGSLEVTEQTIRIMENIKITSTGNIGNDVQLSGTNMSDGGTGTINVSKQKYAFCSGLDYDSDGTALTSSAVEEELNIAKTTTATTPYWREVFWGLEIPSDLPTGTYTGSNTIISVMDESATWGHEEFCIDDGLVAYWPMDDNVSGSGQTIEDSSGNDYDGTTSGTPDCTVSGKYSYGCDFTGDTDTDIINMGDPTPDLLMRNADGWSDSFTVTAWINIDDFSQDEGAIVGKFSGNWSFLFRTTTDESLEVLSVNYGSKKTADDSLSTNTWQHVAVTFNDQIDDIEFYIDGDYESKSSDPSWGGGFTNNNKDLTVGRRWDGYDEVDGTIDEVRIYDRILSSEEIKQLYNHDPS